MYVGNDPLPSNNTPCNANPQRSGVFSCGGKVGFYLGLYKPVSDYMNICEIRAYSWTANSYTGYSYNTSPISSCATITNLVFPTVSSTPCKTATCQMPLSGGSSTAPAFYEIAFDITRFVQAITVIGNS